MAKGKFRPRHLSYGLVFLPTLFLGAEVAEAKDVKDIRDIVSRIRGYTTKPSPPHPPPINIPQQQEHLHDPFDSKMEQYYGMAQMKLNNLVQLTVEGMWRCKGYVQNKHRSADPKILQLISVDVGTTMFGIGVWDESKDAVERVKRRQLSNIRSTLKNMMTVDSNKCFGLVIGLPLSLEGIGDGMEREQQHVKDFIRLLDADPFFYGIPFCFVNEHGSTTRAIKRCNSRKAEWEKRRKNRLLAGGSDIGPFQFYNCKDTESAAIIMETFIWKVKQGHPPPEAD